jgi:tryptophan 2,3-dioxygenase
MTVNAKNLATLEQLLTAARDLAPEVIDEALMIVQSRHAVHDATNIWLQNALASIRIGRPQDAAGYIQRALDIQTRWAVR